MLMKTLVVFYSYTGHTKALAQELAAKEPAGLAEIKDVKRPGTLKAYTFGCFDAIRGKARPIRPLDADLRAYDCLFLLSPVWAGNPPPAVNAFLTSLPEGMSVSVKMVSASGKSACKERLEAAVKAKGGVLDGFEDIKG